MTRPVSHEVKHSHDYADSVLLTYDARFLRRKVLTSQNGLEFLVDLPKTQSVNSGDVFVLDNGQHIAVAPAEEELIEITGNLVRLAWHIGNRHMPCQIEETRLLIQKDHVMEKMLDQLGASFKTVQDIFTPEGGAYGHGRTHSHAH